MFKTAFAAACTALFLTVFAASPAQAAAGISKPLKSGEVEAGGLQYHYQIHGEGEPLLLLHGGLGLIEMFGPVLSMLAAEREVIAIDLQGHGRSELGDRPISLEAMGDDMASILEQLGYDRVDAMGYSMGGGVVLRLAVQHPDKVRRIALVSAGFAQEGFYPEMLPMQAQVGAGMAEMMKDTPMYQSYAAVAPDPSLFPDLLDRMGAFMRKPYNFAEDVKTLDMPVMLVFGDSDMYRPEHIVAFYQLLGGGLKDAGWQRENMSQNRLAILPNLTHYDIGVSPRLAETVLPFLNDDQVNAPWTADDLMRK
ncbi:MAG: alpha/beta hydrolase [Nitratireductor sp.]|uniref:alpha/beta fold hydrolase n=1 Tax=Nitratireductor sp. B36 TaxID=2762059 RepID=UPI000C91DCAE|nr:alpha/beta hydrolase [Nitratireductor sp. B36]MAS13029.1 alpha/beta hydrolase [Nitratireductor sp.]MCC5779464.1 alpha/beta hydrolase [Nitratireductor sp. B36]